MNFPSDYIYRFDPAMCAIEKYFFIFLIFIFISLYSRYLVIFIVYFFFFELFVTQNLNFLDLLGLGCIEVNLYYIEYLFKSNLIYLLMNLFVHHILIYYYYFILFLSFFWDIYLYGSFDYFFVNCLFSSFIWVRYIYFCGFFLLNCIYFLIYINSLFFFLFFFSNVYLFFIYVIQALYSCLFGVIFFPLYFFKFIIFCYYNFLVCVLSFFILCYSYYFMFIIYWCDFIAIFWDPWFDFFLYNIEVNNPLLEEYRDSVKQQAIFDYLFNYYDFVIKPFLLVNYFDFINLFFINKLCAEFNYLYLLFNDVFSWSNLYSFILILQWYLIQYGLFKLFFAFSFVIVILLKITNLIFFYLTFYFFGDNFQIILTDFYLNLIKLSIVYYITSFFHVFYSFMDYWVFGSFLDFNVRGNEYPFMWVYDLDGMFLNCHTLKQPTKIGYIAKGGPGYCPLQYQWDPCPRYPHQHVTLYIIFLYRALLMIFKGVGTLIFINKSSLLFLITIPDYVKLNTNFLTFLTPTWIFIPTNVSDIEHYSYEYIPPYLLEHYVAFVRYVKLHYNIPDIFEYAISHKVFFDGIFFIVGNAFFLFFIFLNCLFFFFKLSLLFILFYQFYFFYFLIKNKIDVYIMFTKLKNLYLFFFYRFVEVLFFYYSRCFNFFRYLSRDKPKKIVSVFVSSNNKINIKVDYVASLSLYLYKLFINKILGLSLQLNRILKVSINKWFFRFFFKKKMNLKFLNVAKIQFYGILYGNFLLSIKQVLQKVNINIDAFFVSIISNSFNIEARTFYKFNMYLNLRVSYLYWALSLFNNGYVLQLIIKSKGYSNYILTKELKRLLSFNVLLHFYKIILKNFNFYKLYKNMLEQFFNLYIFFDDVQLIHKKYENRNRLFSDSKKIIMSNLSLLKIKKNPVINFLYSDFFFSKKDFIIFYNNKFFDLFGLVLFKKTFSYDFFLKDIFHTVLLSFDEKNDKFLSASNDVFANNNILFNHNAFLSNSKKTEENFVKFRSILDEFGNAKTKILGDLTLSINTPKKLLTMNIANAVQSFGSLDYMMFDALYNRDILIFEALYNKSNKRPMYSHVNSFFKELEIPLIRLGGDAVLDEYAYFFDVDINYYETSYYLHANGFLESTSNYKVDDVLLNRVDVEPNTLKNILKEKIKKNYLVDDYLLLDNYNYVLSMYDNVWSLINPTVKNDDSVTKDKLSFNLFEESLLMFEYNYYLSVGLIEFTSCIFFYEYKLECIIYYSLVYLYEIVLFYSYNAFSIFNYKGNKNLFIDYISENFYDETLTLWDTYFFYLHENLGFLTNNRYVQNRFEAFNINPSKNSYLYTNAYSKKALLPLTFIDPKGSSMYIDPRAFRFAIRKTKNSVKRRFRHAKKVIKANPGSEDFLLTSVLDLEFYADYIELVDQVYLQDQKLFLYSSIEQYSVQDNDLKLLNNRFFMYLDSVLLSPNQRKRNISPENFFNVPQKKDVESIRIENVLNYDDVFQNYYTGNIQGTEPYFSGTASVNTFLNAENKDSSIYATASVLPFELMQQNMVNVITYFGYEFDYKFTVLDEFLYKFYVDYFFFSIKALTLNVILVNEYHIPLPSEFILGPVNGYIPERRIGLLDDLSLIKEGKFSLLNNYLIIKKKIRNFFFNTDYFETLKMEYNFLWPGVFYYGFYIQLVGIFFILLFDALSANIKIVKSVVSYQEHINYATFPFKRFIEWMSMVFSERTLEFFPDSSDERFFWLTFLRTEPFFDLYVFDETQDYEGYFDRDHFVVSDVFDSVGFNSFLLDVDNRYFSNTGEFSLLFGQTTAGAGYIYMYLYFFRDAFLVLCIRFINYIYLSVFYDNFRRVKWFLKNIAYSIEFFLYIFFSISYIIVTYFKIFIYHFYKYFSECFFLLKQKISFLFVWFLYFNLFYVFFFEFFRIIFEYMHYISVYYFFLIFKNFNFIKNNVRLDVKLFDFFLDFIFSFVFKPFVIFLKYCIYFLFKGFIVYFLVIFLFDHYDNIILYFEHMFNLHFSYRSMFVFYSFLFFLSFLFLLLPSRIGNYMWSLRYLFFVLVGLLWLFSGYINMVELLTIDIWNTHEKPSGTFGFLYGPVFYERFVYNAERSSLWRNLDRVFHSMDNHYLVIFSKYIEVFLADESLKTIEGRKIYYALMALNNSFSVRVKFQHVPTDLYYSLLLTVSHYWAIFTRTIFIMIEPQLPMIESILAYRLYFFKKFSDIYFFQDYFSGIDLSYNAFFKYFFDNYMIIYSKDLTFFTYYYNLFCLTFVKTSMLEYKNYATYILGVYPILGSHFNYFYLRHFGFSKKKVLRSFIAYKAATFNTFKISMWGNYKVNSKHFLLFYARNWDVVESSRITAGMDLCLEGEGWTKKRTSAISKKKILLDVYLNSYRTKNRFYGERLNVLRIMGNYIYPTLNKTPDYYFNLENTTNFKHKRIQAYGKRKAHFWKHRIRYYNVNQFFAPPYNIELDWEEINNRLIDEVLSDADVNGLVQYPYNKIVANPFATEHWGLTKNYDVFAFDDLWMSRNDTVPLYHSYFLRYLIPDLGYIGSSYWFSNPDYLVIPKGHSAEANAAIFAGSRNKSPTGAGKK